MRVEPNHVYVIPPNVQMGIADGDAPSEAAADDRSQYTPIDFFLRSLPTPRRSRAIGVDPLGHGLGRRGRAARHQGGRRHHVRAGPETAQVRRHAARRDRDRHGRPRARRPPRSRPSSRSSRAHPFAPRAATTRRDEPSSSRARRQLRADLRAAARRRAASTSGTTSCRRSSAGCSAAWRCTSSRDVDELRAAARGDAGRGAAPLPGPADPRHALLPRARVVRGARRAGLPQLIDRPARQTADPHLGARAAPPARRPTRSRSRCSSSCGDQAGRVPVQIFATDVSETRDRACAQRRLPGEHRRRRVARAPAALLHKSTAATASPRRARPLRLRAAGPDARPAVLAARPDPLPQRADLPGRAAAAAS